VAAIFLDQVTKWLVSGKVEVVVNRGISGGLLSQNSGMLLVFISLVVMVLVGVVFYSVWQKYPLLSGIFFGAGISNIVDRLLFGGVRDWLLIPVVNWRNNVADYLLFVVVIIIVFQELNKVTLNEDND